MRSLADLLAFIGLWWSVQHIRLMRRCYELERDATTDKEVRAYLTDRIAEKQAELDRLYINNLPLIERRLKGQTA